MANINNELNKIKKAIHGKDVRGSIHDGIEKINEEVEGTTGRQDSVEAQFQSVLDETTGKDVISAPEINAAKVGADNTNYPNLKQRLDTEHNQVTEQLAETEAELNQLDADKLDKTDADRIRNENNALVQAYLIELDALRSIISTNYASSIEEGISTGLAE